MPMRPCDWSFAKFAAPLFLMLLSPAILHAQDVSALGETKPFSISGSLYTQAQHYSSSLGNNTGRPDVTGTLSLNSVVSVYGVQFPFGVNLTTSQATFRQPFNEFGLSPRYKWITAHLGYRSVYFSQYSLSYQRWLGAGVELRQSRIRLSMMYGRFQKEFEEDTVRHAPAIYKRMGYAVKLGYGSDADFLDLTLFKAWDDSSSLDPAMDYALRPLSAENVVLTAASRVSLLSSKLVAEGELAGSVFTRDLGAPTQEVAGIPSFMSGLLRVTSSTRANYALRGSLTYTMRSYRLALKYERIGPNYTSMGVGYITPDREDITVAPSAALFNTLRLNASVGVRRNNLSGDKLTITRRLITSVGGSWQATSDLGLDLRYANYSNTSADGLRRVTDTTRIENVSQSFSGGPRYSFGNDAMRQSLSVYLSYQMYDDRNIVSGALNRNNAQSGALNYSGTLDEYSVNGSLSHSRSEATTYANTTTSISAGATKAYLDQKLNLGAMITYSRTQSAIATDAQFLPAFNASYQLSSRDAFSFSTQLSQNARTNDPYTEVFTSAGYSRTF